MCGLRENREKEECGKRMTPDISRPASSKFIVGFILFVIFLMWIVMLDVGIEAFKRKDPKLIVASVIGFIIATSWLLFALVHIRAMMKRKNHGGQGSVGRIK